MDNNEDAVSFPYYFSMFGWKAGRLVKSGDCQVDSALLLEA